MHSKSITSQSYKVRICTTYLVYFFFEALFEHLVSFVKNDSLEAGEVDVSSFNVVEDSSASANKEVDSASQSSSLVIN